MDVPIDAKGFLGQYAAAFENEAVRGWQWVGDDDDFGKSLSWDVRPYDPAVGQTVEVNASVDLQLTQLTLAISERDMTDGNSAATETSVVFEVLVQFEDRTLSVNGVEQEYSDSAIRAAILEFNERTR